MKLSRALVCLPAVVAISFGLAGCGATAPAPTALPTATAPSPSPTPLPTADPEVRVVISTLTLDIYSDDELTSSWAHEDRDPAEVTALTEAFGSTPESSTESRPFEGGLRESQHYTWPGFNLSMITSEHGPRQFYIEVSAPTVGETQVEALGGIQVGDDAQEVANEYPDFAYTIDTPSGQWLRIGIDPILTGSDSGDRPAADFVGLEAVDPLTTVTTIRVPAANYGM